MANSKFTLLFSCVLLAWVPEGFGQTPAAPTEFLQLSAKELGAACSASLYLAARALLQEGLDSTPANEDMFQGAVASMTLSAAVAQHSTDLPEARTDELFKLVKESPGRSRLQQITYCAKLGKGAVAQLSPGELLRVRALTRYAIEAEARAHLAE